MNSEYLINQASEPRKPIYIIAEAGVNHNGSVERAKELVRIAAQAGADAVKFQTFRAEALVTKTAPKAQYQIENTKDAGNQFEMLRALELSPAAHEELFALCRSLDIEFLSTPFDVDSARFLANLGVQRFKVSSGDLTNAPLLLELASCGLPVILSTGMSTLGEIEQALAVLSYGYIHAAGAAPSRDEFFAALGSADGINALRRNVTLLQCTSEYPAPYESINLQAIDTLSAAFNLEAGLSDHSQGIAIAIAASARGARVIEKHFTISRELPGPDHKASLEPDELAEMIKSIRQVEMALGDGYKLPCQRELQTRLVAAKSVVAMREIRAGEAFSAENLTVKRPGTGLAPIHYWDLLGKPADKNYSPDEVISPALGLLVRVT